MAIELKKILLITDVLGHSILQNYVVELRVVLTPFLNLHRLIHTASCEILKSYSSNGSSLTIVFGLFSTMCNSFMSSFSFP
jgi:hypothetical protein